MKNSKFYFYLNPHDEYKWTRCPKCDNKTKVRKFCLMIHYEEKSAKFHRMVSLNKSCKYCPYCDLIIAQKSEIDYFMDMAITSFGKRFKPESYLVFGTLPRSDWKRNQVNPMMPNETLELSSPFKDIWDFEIRPAGWYFEDE